MEESMFRIREILIERGMTPQYLADNMGVSKQYISNILAERSMPSIRTLSRLAKVIGVPVSALFEDSIELLKMYCPEFVPYQNGYVSAEITDIEKRQGK